MSGFWVLTYFGFVLLVCFCLLCFAVGIQVWFGFTDFGVAVWLILLFYVVWVIYLVWLFYLIWVVPIFGCGVKFAGLVGFGVLYVCLLVSVVLCLIMRIGWSVLDYGFGRIRLVECWLAFCLFCLTCFCLEFCYFV